MKIKRNTLFSYARGAAFFLLAGGAATAAAAEIAVVLNSGDASISVIDPVARQELRRFDTGKEPHHLMITPDARSLIVANAAGNDLQFIDPLSAAPQRRVHNIADPYQIGYSPDRHWFVVNALRLNRVDVYAIDGEDFRLVKSLKLPKAPSHMIFSGDSSTVFVTLQESNEIAAIRLTDQTLLWKMNVGDLPAGIWMTPDDRHLLVGIMGRDYVDVIDWRAQKSVKQIKTGKGAHNFRPLGDGRHVFVSNRVDNTISLVDQNTFEKVYDIAVPGGPDCMDVSADGQTLWVTQRWKKQVSIIDIAQRRVVQSISVGRSPHGVFLSRSAAWK